MRTALRALWTDEQGQGLTEYALLLVLVSLGLFLVLGEFRDELQNVFEDATDVLEESRPIQGAPD